MPDRKQSPLGNPVRPELVYWPVGHGEFHLKDHLKIAQAGSFDGLAIAPNRAKSLLMDGYRPSDLLDWAAEHGLRYSQLDGLATWVKNWRATRGDPDLNAWIGGLFDIDMIEALDIGAALNVGSVVAVPFYDEGSIGLDEAVESFGRFCDSASARGIEVHIEFIPFWGVPTIAEAWDIVSAADCSNSGILVDTWHMQKGGRDFEAELDLLREIPGDRLKHVQLADADLTPRADTLAEDVMYRKFPGEGELRMVEMLSIIADKGGLASVGPEVIGHELQDMDLNALGQRAERTTRALLEQAGIHIA